MSVRRRTRTRTDGKTTTRWVVDVKFRHADGRIERVRRTPRIQSRVGAERLEREIRENLEGRSNPVALKASAVSCPTLAVFWERFLRVHVVPNNKPSEQWTKARVMKIHLLPQFGRLALDQIYVSHLEEYKARLIGLQYAPKTINNHLTLLRTILRAARDWRVISEIPRIKLMRAPQSEIVFLNF